MCKLPQLILLVGVCFVGSVVREVNAQEPISVLEQSVTPATSDTSPSDLLVPKPLAPQASGIEEVKARPAAVASSDEPKKLSDANAAPLAEAKRKEKLSGEGVSLASVAEPILSASAKDPSQRRLQEIVLRARESLDPNDLPDIEEAKQELYQAIARVQSYVGIETRRGQQWSDFLKLDEIIEEVEKKTPDFRRFIYFEMNMRQNYPGLENGPMLELRRALDKARRALTYGRSPETTIEVLERRIDQFVSTLNEGAETDLPPARAEFETVYQLGRIANYFHEMEQTPWALTELRSQFGVPNVQVYAKESILNRFLSRPVAQPSPVDECILGTRILGRAFLSGNVSADILPMHNGVAMKLNMSANMTSTNRGYNRGVVLRTTGSSPVFATKTVYASLDGISSSPTEVATNLMTSVNGIEHRLRIVRRIARKQAAKQKPQADAISEGRLQTRLRQEYDQQVEEQLMQARGQLASVRQKSQTRPEFQRLDVPRPSLAVYSTSNTVNANVMQAATFQLAASEPCKIKRPRTSQVVLELHESALNNLLHSVLAGRTIRHHDLDDLAMQILGRVPEELAEMENQEQFEVEFPTYNPISVELANNQVRLTLRFAQVTGADRTLRGATVSVTYSPSYRRGVFTLRRDGDLEIDVTSARSNIARTSLNSALRAKMEPLFKETIVTEKLDLSTMFPNARNLVLNWIKIDSGWAQIGLR